MDNKINIWSSISSVLEGNSSEEEKLQVADWTNKDERNLKFFDRLKNGSFNPETEEKAVRVQNLIYLKTREKINRIQLKRKLRLWQYIAAASITLLLIVSGFNFLQTESVIQPIAVELRSPMGSTTRLTLDDGTIVELNAGSTLSYPSFFKGDNRTVSLTGEAYFEVAKDTKHPFIVEANQMKVEVLGTHFNVKSYEEDNRLVTTLLEGSVSVEINSSEYLPNKPVILKPNQQIIFNKETNKIDISNVNSSLYASWKDGECFFESENLKDIIKILERQFGIPITIADKELEKQIYSGFFTQKEGLFHILNSFRRNRPLDYRQIESGIEIYQRENK